MDKASTEPVKVEILPLNYWMKPSNNDSILGK